MKPLLSSLVIALVVCAVSIAGYGTWYAVITAKSGAVADLQNQIDTKIETVHRIAATRASLASVANDETLVQGYFVPEASVVNFIDSLETHGKALGATVNVLSVAKSGTTAQPSLTLFLSVTGTFDAVMRTVGTIEFAAYDLSISSLSVTQDGKGAWHADLKLLVGSVPASRVPPVPAAATSSTSSTVLDSPSSPYAYS